MPNNPSSGREKLNQRLLSVPTGAVLTTKWLRSHGISNQLAEYYVGAGWLNRVGDGAFTVQKGVPTWLAAVYGLQQKSKTFHPGGRTGLELAGLAHFLPLGKNYPLYLFGSTGERLPEWFKNLPWAERVQHVRTNFLPADLGLGDHREGALTVRVSSPERAILEFLKNLSLDESGYEHANLVFEGLGTLRAPLAQSLLESCSSIKVKRLFLHFATRHAHPWFGQLDESKVALGSGKRVVFPRVKLDPKYLITVPSKPATPTDAP